MMVLPRDKDGRQRHVRDLDQKLVAFRPEGIFPGNLVGVVSGEHEGMFARVVQLLAGDKVRIRFESEEVRSYSEFLFLFLFFKMITNC
jgi:hypothetical protein